MIRFLAALALACALSSHAQAFAVAGTHDVPSGLTWGAACGAIIGIFFALILISVRARREPTRGLCALAALVVLIFGVSPALADPAGAGIRPDPVLTAGAVRTAGKAVNSDGTEPDPKRVERYTVISTTAGVASFSWTACTATPDLEVLETWIPSGPTRLSGAVTASTLSTATVQVYESATIALGGQPFKASTTARSVTLRVICS